MNIKQHLKDHVFFYILALVIILSLVASFYRFIIKNDYIVSYEGSCDPSTQSCFQNCEDDDCTYYTKIQKYAPDIYSECGKDITDCETANICLPSDRKCLVAYCDTNIDTDCEIITENTQINNLDTTKETQ